MKSRFFCRGLVVVWMLAAGALFSPAATGPQTFSNPDTIVLEEILRGPGTPYPSSIGLSGFTTAVSKVTVTLHNIAHSFPDDLDIVLVGPRGQSVMLMSDAGSELDVADVTLTFDDSAATVPPNSAQLVSGTFRPVNHPLLNDTNPPPAPPPPYGAALSVFNGTDPNGVWSLYVLDDTSEDGGAIVDGWSLTLSTDEPIADLALAMITSPTIAAIGTNITYTVFITNKGPASATGVTVVDDLPPGLAFISAETSSGACSNENGVVRCDVGALPVGAGARVEIVATPVQDGILTNTVTVIGHQRDHQPSNNSAASAVPVTAVTDLAIRVAAQTAILQGELLNYAVAVTNEGAASATGVSLSFPLPEGVIFVSADPAGSCTNNGGTVQCSLGSLDGHAATTVTFSIRSPGARQFTNMVAVTGDQFDHDLDDNTGRTIVDVHPAADISLVAQPSAEPAGLGQRLTYVIAVSNLGPAAAAVTLINGLPPSVDFVSATGANCTNDGGTVWCDLGSIDSGAVRALNITVRPTVLGTITNAFTIIPNLADPIADNNSAAVITTVVPAADLAVVVVQSPDPVWRPELFAYTVTVSNTGPSTANDVVLQNMVPGTVPLLSFEITQGGCINENGTLVCDVGTLENGQSATLTVVMAAHQVGPLTNRASVTALQLDGDLRNNSVTLISAAVAPAVRLLDSASLIIPESGIAELYPSTLFVSGLTSGVQQVRVSLNSLHHERLDDLDILLVAPNGRAVMLISDAGGDTAVDEVDLRFDAGAVQELPDATLFESGTFKPTDHSEENAPDEFPAPAPPGPYSTDLSTFIGMDPNGPWSLYIVDDQPGASGVLFDGWTLEIAATAPIADVVITGVDLPTVIAIGSNTFSITVSNQGPFIARDLRVMSAFATELGVQAVMASQGGCAMFDGLIVCPVGDVAPGSNVVLTVSIAPAFEAVTTNLISAFGQFTDFEPSNNAISFVTAVDRPPTILVAPQDMTLTNLGAAQFTAVVSGTQPLQFQWLLNELEIAGATNSTLILANPGPEYEGGYRVRVSNRVGSAISDPATLFLAGPPRISAIPDQSTDEDTPAAIPFLVRDAESFSEELTVTAVSSNVVLLPDNAIAIEGSGDERIMRVTPSQNQHGATLITVRVEDTQGGFSTRSFLLTVRPVNDPPMIPSIQPQVINEDTQRVLRLILGDIDSDHASLVLTGSSSNSAVVADSDITISGSGIGQTVTILPVTNAYGTTVITLSLTDAEGSNTVYRFPLTVLPVNDPPSIDAIANFIVDEDSGPHTISLTGISSGVGNETQRLRLSATSNRPDIVPHPTIDYTSPDATGLLTVTPATNAHGTATIAVTVNDSQSTNSAVTRSFTVTVQPVDDPPGIAHIPDQVMAEDTTIFIPLVVHDPDTLNGLTIIADSSNPDLVSNLVAGVVTTNHHALAITPNSNQVGTATITVIATDLAGLTASNMFLLTVTPANDPPTLDALTNIDLDENAAPQTIALTGIGPGAPDEHEQTVTINAVSSNPDLIPHPTVTYNSPEPAGMLLFEIVPGQYGTSLISVTANDGQSSNSVTTRTVRITVHRGNEPPTIAPIPDVITSEDMPVVIPLAVGDSDGAVALLSVSAMSSNPNVVANTNIVIEGAGAERIATIFPNAELQGATTITLTVSDGHDSSSSSFLFTVAPVNDPPTLDPVPNVTVTEGRGLFQVNFSGVSSGATNESQSLDVSVVSQNTSLLTVQSVVYSSPNAAGTLRLRTANSGTGLATVVLTVDDNGASNNITTRAFTVLITPDSNTPPTISDIADQTTVEDTPLTPISFTVSDAQTPANELAVSASSSNPDLVPPDNIVLGGTGDARTIAIFPATKAAGSSLITVSVRDGAFSEVIDTFLLTVTPVNDPPSVTEIEDVVLVEDGPPAEVAFNLTDIDNSPEELIVTVSPSTLADLIVVGTGTNRALVITPKPDQAGSETLTVSVTDGVETAVQDVQFTITPVNDSPNLGIQTEHVALEDTPIEIPFVLIDPDTPAEQISLVAVSSDQSLVPDANMSFGGSGTNRTLLITPASDQFGQTLITVSAIDDLDSIVTRTVMLTIAPVNDPPTLGAISNIVIAANGASITINLAGASPGPSNESQSIAFDAVSSNTSVLAPPEVDSTFLQSSNIARLLLSPVPGTRGVSTVTVLASDGQAYVSRTFIVSVDGPPSIQSIPDQFTEVEASAPPVRLTIADPESGSGPLTLAIQASNPALFATVALSGGGAIRTLTLSPVPQQIGASMIHVIVSDPRGNSASNSFLFTVGPSSKPPAIQLQPENRTVAEGETIVLQVVASGHPLSFQWQRDRADLSGETNATLTLLSAQPGQSGDYRVLVSNPNGSVASATATIRILPVPRIVSIIVEQNAVRLSVATVPGETYTVESHGALSESTWTPIVTFSATENEATITDEVFEKRLYRIRVE